MSWLPKQKVVVPIDLSDRSMAVVEVAIKLVEDATHLYVIHVLPIITEYELGMVWTDVNDAERIARVREAIAERLSATKYSGINVEIGLGDAGHEIVDYAESIAADLIAMPSHSRSGLTRFLIGSVAERVVRLAHCPVLVLKQHEDKHRKE